MGRVGALSPALFALRSIMPLGGGVLNVYFGSCVALLLLWTMRVATNDQLTFHLLGLTAITLMFGWSLTVILAAIVLSGVTLNNAGSWELFAINALTTSAIPASLTMASLVIVRSLLPKNFFLSMCWSMVFSPQVWPR